MTETTLSAASPAPVQRYVQCASPAGLHRMAYTEWGDPANERVLVCVHGLTRSGRDFDHVRHCVHHHTDYPAMDVEHDDDRLLVVCRICVPEANSQIEDRYDHAA